MADIYSLGVIIIEIITGHKFGPSGTDLFRGDFVEPVRNCLSTFNTEVLLKIRSHFIIARNLIQILQVLKNWRNRLLEAACISVETDCLQIKFFLELGIKCSNFYHEKRPTIRNIIDMISEWETTHYYVNDEAGPGAKQVFLNYGKVAINSSTIFYHN